MRNYEQPQTSENIEKPQQRNRRCKEEPVGNFTTKKQNNNNNKKAQRMSSTANQPNGRDRRKNH